MSPTRLPARDAAAYERWRARTDGPLLLLAVLFLVTFVVPLYVPDLPFAVRALVLVVDVAVWVAFAVDYLVRWRLSPDRGRYVRDHVPDLLVLVVPVLRPLRVLRVAGVLAAASRRAGRQRLVRTTAYVCLAVAALVVVAGGMVLDAERGHPDANITTAGDALWWASTTVTTVGYGDRFPVTGEGRLVAVALMVGGIALLGLLTAGVAAWFVRWFTALETIEDVIEQEGDETARALADIAARLDRIEAALQQRA